MKISNDVGENAGGWRSRRVCRTHSVCLILIILVIITTVGTRRFVERDLCCESSSRS